MRIEVKAEPCLTCPYRKDVPSGVWGWEEYEKLRQFDGFATGVFLCHTGLVADTALLCKGWVMVHADNIPVRIACARGTIDHTTAFAECDAELHESGNAAADFGQRDIDQPRRKALKVIQKLENTGRFKGNAEEES